MVVVGDSQFAANRCLTGANELFFVNSLDWLLERNEAGVAPSGEVGLYTLQIETRGRVVTFLLIVVAMPCALVGLAFFVAMARRDRRVQSALGRKGTTKV